MRKKVEGDEFGGGLGEDGSGWDLELGWGKTRGGKKGEGDNGWVPM